MARRIRAAHRGRPPGPADATPACAAIVGSGGHGRLPAGAVALLGGVSASAFLSATGGTALLALALATQPAVAASPPPGSPQWVSQRAAARAQGLPASAANPTTALSPEQRAQMQRSMRNLTRASDALRAQLAGQAGARAAALRSNTPLPDGLADGGLKVHPGINALPGVVWSNAELPREQRDAAGDVEVTIRQTGQKAILSWESFNVGAKTTLDFDQQGNRDWVALNRVLDTTRPSQIQGRITADGQVYVINRNGILFTGTSQVNVGGLVASSLDIGLPYQTLADRNRYFLENANGTLSFSFNLQRDAAGNLAGRVYQGSLDNGVFATESFVPEADALEGAVEVQAGAVIRTEALSQANQFLGRVVLAAPRVANAGTIETPDGQALLVGARNFTLINNDAGSIASLQQSNRGFNDGVLSSLAVDPELRGAQVLAGAADFFTTRGPVEQEVLRLSPDWNPLVHVRRVFLNARNALTADGRPFTAPLVDAPLFDPADPGRGRAFSVVNAGLISAARGNITLRAQKIALSSAPADGFEGGEQHGMLHVTTAVNANGSVFADAQAVQFLDATVLFGLRQTDAAELRLAPSSVLAMMPDLVHERDDATAAAGDAMLGLQPTLPSDAISSAQFRRPVARLNADGAIALEGGALIVAPSAAVSLASIPLIVDPETGQFTQIEIDPLTGVRRERTPIEANVRIAAGAEIDVAGLSDVELAMASNVVRIARVGSLQLADLPLQRNSFLFGSEIFIDRRISGVSADGTTWVGSPLLDARGDVEARGRTVSELLTRGGDITLSGVVHADAGSVLNVSGGFVRYADGIAATTRLRTADGGILIDIGSADPNVSYGGLAGQFVRTQSRWNLTEVFPSVIGSRSGRVEQGYVEGGDAGRISVDGAAVLDATLHAGVVIGPYQRQGSGAFAAAAPRAGTLDLSRLTGRPDFNIVTPAAGDAAPASSFIDQSWSTTALADAGFGDIRFGSVGSTIRVDDGAHLVLPDGGSLRLSGQQIDIAGDITAHGGTVTLDLAAFLPQSRRFGFDFSTVPPPRTTLTVHDGATIDLSGRWVNDTGARRDALVGSDWINGGSLTVRSGAYVSSSYIPDFASVRFAAGSLVNLNSGGYVTPRGDLATGSHDVPLGRGGDFSILLHPAAATPSGINAIFDRGTLVSNINAPAFVHLDVQTLGLPPAERRALLDDQIELAGTITAFGFQGGGTFSLRAPEIDIRSGGGIITGERGRIAVPAEFLAEQGFGAYAFTGLLRAGVDAGTTVTLSQRQFVPQGDVATATGVGDVAVVGSSSGLQRPAVDFSMAGLGWTDYQFIGQSFSGSYFADRALSIGEGAQILGDPGAWITLAAQGQLTLAGRVRAPGGTVTLNQISGGAAPLGDNSPAVSFRNTSLFLAGSAEIDTDGAFIADPTQRAVRDGVVLAGGRVTLSSEQLIGLAGSRILASGTSALLDLPQLTAGPLTSLRIPTAVGSDAGSIAIVSNGSGAFDTTLIARPGTAGNAGGTLSIRGPAITVVDDAATVPAGAEPAAFIPDVAPGQPFPFGTVLFSTARLSDSGIDALHLGANAGGRSSSDPERGSIAFSGAPSITLGRQLELTASNLRWLRDGVIDPIQAPSGSDPFAFGGILQPGDTTTVRLAAPYIRVTRIAYETTNPSAIAAPGGARRGPTLEVATTTLDLAGRAALFNWGRTAIDAAGDIRLLPGRSDAGLNSYFAGLVSGGDIELTAAQIYPSSGVSALIQSIAATRVGRVVVPDGRISVRSNGAAAPVPLSAGGRLVLSANRIVQEGVLRAPLGSIQLGVTDAGDIDVNNALRDPLDFRVILTPTASVQLAAGSLTSVSAEGTLIPWGETRQQKDWFFDDTAVIAAPAKRIAVVGAEAVLEDGAVLDLSGGGDVYASEFVPGLGGSRNILRTSLNGDASAPVYALLPGVQPAVAPVDPALQGDIPDAPGLTLTLLADIPGGPRAGTYTLVPGSYATQPGAWRVQRTSTRVQDLPAGRAVPRPDGSFTVAGFTGSNATASGSGRTDGWTVMSGPVWRRYTEIQTTGGNAFFSRLARNEGQVAAPLPADAGRLALEVTSRLVLDARLQFATDVGGRGGQVDIAAPRIAVAATAAGFAPGFLLITPETIRTLGAESLVLGAIRTDDGGGERLDIKASELRVRTTRDDPLVNPELMLAATDAVVVEAGSVLRAEGATRGGTAGRLVIGRNEVPALFAFLPPLVPGISGDGGLIRLSTAGLAAVERINLPAAPKGTVVLAENVVLDGGQALSIDAAAEATIDPTAAFFARSVDLASTNINILAPDGTPGANIGRAALDGILVRAEALSLRARNAVNFYGASSIRAAAGSPRLASLTLNTPSLAAVGLTGGSIDLDAGTVTLTNDGAAAIGDPSIGDPVAAAGRLAISADRLLITGADKRGTGFAETQLTAGQAISFGDGKQSGSLHVAGDVLLDAPLIVAATGGTQTLRTTGAISAVNSAGIAAGASDEIGGKLVLDGASVRIGTTLAAVAGALELNARSGDVQLDDGARLLAHGYRQAFLDHAVMLAGGRVLLQADAGDVGADAGAVIDVAAVTAGNAGSLQVLLGSAVGRFDVAGSLLGGADADRTGGAFVLDSAGSVALDPVAAATTAGGFTERFAVRSGTGDLALSQSLRAHAVTLVADGGAVAVQGGGTVIDASGAGGGRIELYGRDGVTLASGASLLARASDRTQRGGQVDIGTGDGGNLNLLAGSQIDVSGGAPYGAGGGVIQLRTPIARALDATLAAAFVRSPVVDVAGAALTPVIFEPYTRFDLGAGDVTLTGAQLTALLDAFQPATAAIEARHPGLQVRPGLELVTASGDLAIRDAEIDLSGRRFGASADQPGWLSLRAAGDVRIDADISDGFTSATAAGELRTVSFADVAGGTLPASARSWSYRFAAGARTDSADPLAVAGRTEAGDFRFGDALYDPVRQYRPDAVNRLLPDATRPLGRNAILRTGTGSIAIAAAGDVRLLNPTSAIYTAGVGIDWTTIPDFVDRPQSLTDPTLRDLVARSAFFVDVNPALVGLVGTLPALPTLGGDLRILAGGNVSAQQHVTDVTGRLTGRPGSVQARASYIGQVFSPWLYFQGAASLSPDAAGQFGGFGSYTSAAGAIAEEPARQTATWVTTGSFQQGFATLGGGDLSVRAGGDVRNASFSVVSASAVAGGKQAGAAITPHHFGGGALHVDAGGDIASGIFYVGRGSADIRAGGAVTSGYDLPITNGFAISGAAPVGTVLGFGDAGISVQARREIDVGQVLSDTLAVRYVLDSDRDPRNGAIRARPAPLLSSYAADNRLSLRATSGDVSLSRLVPAPSTYGLIPLFGIGNQFNTGADNYLPPALEMVAARGDVTLASDRSTVLAPSPTGTLDLLAEGSVRYSFRAGSASPDLANPGWLSMLDIAPALLSNPLNPNSFLALVLAEQGRGYQLDRETVLADARLNRFSLHAGPRPLHFDDRQPARIIALTGDVVSGAGLASDPVPGIGVGQGGAIFLNKQALISAGRNIVNLTYTGENNRDADVTWIRAGRDFTYSLETLVGGNVVVTRPAGGSIVIGGPGTLVVDAGRNLDLRPSQPSRAASSASGDPGQPALPYGVLSVGNRINPYRPFESADVELLFGTGPGRDVAGFVARYVDPAGAGLVERTYLDELLAFMNARALALGEPGDFTADEALDSFRLLPEREQMPFVQRVLFEELRAIAPSADSFVTINQRRAFEAIDTLFPASDDPLLPGYTDNLAADPQRVATGDFTMLNALLRTDYGSAISILGPGGDALIGGFTVDDSLPLNFQGIFTLRGGAINAFLDGSLNVNNSRMLTAQGGDITVFTANGNIDAGRGKKTASFSPPIQCAYTADVTCSVDFGGLITGSGIGTLVTLPGTTPGDVYLIAPRGSIDAGEAGIRAAGDLVVVALTVLNAANIQVGGASVGVAQSSGVPASASLTSASSQAELGNKALQELATAAGGRPMLQDLPSIISVEVLGFGS